MSRCATVRSTVVPLRYEGAAPVPKTFSMSLAEIDVLTEHFRLGRFHYPYEIPFVGTTVGERDEHRAEVWQQLADRGLAHGRELKADPERALRLWSRPDVLVTLEAHEIESDAEYLYRAGLDSKLGLVSRQQGEQLVFVLLFPEQVAPTLVDYLPDLRPFPGRGATATMPAAAAGDRGAMEDVPARNSLGEAQRFFDYPLQRLGSFSVNVRGSQGMSNRTSAQWFDSTEGRFMLVSEPLPDGGKRRTFIPTDGSHLRRWIREQADGAGSR